MDEPRGAYPTNPGSSIPASRISPEDRGGSGDHFAALLGLSRSGRLRFTNGAHRIIIQADSRLRGLYRARFGDRMPKVEARRGIVTIQYPRFPGGDWPNDRSERPAEVELNASIPWDIEVRGGASRLLINLSGLRLRALKVDGGVSRLQVVLPAPSGIVTVVILGGASNLSIDEQRGSKEGANLDREGK